MRRQFVAIRMHWGKGNQTRSLDDHRTKTSEEDWLIDERLPGGESKTKYYFSNLPAKTSLKELATAVRSRWPIRQFYEDAKQLCGLGDFQGWRWDGLHRHVLLALLTDLVQRWVQMRQPGLPEPFAHLPDRAPPGVMQLLTK